MAARPLLRGHGDRLGNVFDGDEDYINNPDDVYDPQNEVAERAPIDMRDGDWCPKNGRGCLGCAACSVSEDFSDPTERDVS